MFGYINTNPETLSEEEKGAYQSYYCGLCRVLRSDCGRRGQMLLAYDMTFLVVLLTGLYELESKKESFTCALHPAKKRNALINDATDYAAAMNLVLGYHNLLDDWIDDGSAVKKRLADRLESDYARVAGRYPRQVEAAQAYLERIGEAERDWEMNLDVASGASGAILSEIFAWRDDEWSDELKCLGFHIGKFVYLMDAYEDMEKDRRNHAYNPLIPLAGEKSTEEYETLCRCYLESLAGECARSFERLPVLIHADLIRNILYSGIWSRYEILQKKKKSVRRRSRVL